MTRPVPTFITWLGDVLAPLGAIRARSMFGGWGLYCDGLFFAIVADDRLYLKTDANNRQAFEQAGSEPFQPFPDKPGVMNYHRLPDEALDEPEALIGWARQGRAAALRAKP